MSTSGLLTMLTTWAIISYFTIRFFLKVLKAPPHDDSAG
jgi:hypothetical protein